MIINQCSIFCRANDMDNLQKLVDDFNAQYFKAANDAAPYDWMKAALAGRHIVNELVSSQGIKDSLPILQNKAK
jgi:hypothetical protein